MFLESFAQDDICYEARKLWKLPKMSPVIMDQMQEVGKTETKKIHPKKSNGIRNYETFNCAEKWKNEKMQRDIFGDDEIGSCQFCSSIARSGATVQRTFVTHNSDKRQVENMRPCYECSRNLRHRSEYLGPLKRRRNSLRTNKGRQPNWPYFDSNNNKNFYKTVWGYEADYSEGEEDETGKMIRPNGDANCPVDSKQYIVDNCACRVPVVTSQPVVISGRLDRPKYLISDSQGRIQRICSNVQWTGKNNNVITSFPPPQHQRQNLPQNGTSLPARFFGSALSIASTSIANSCWRCFGSDESEESDYSSESGSDTEAEDTEHRGSDVYNHINDSDGSQVSEVEDSSGGSDNSDSDPDMDDSMSLYEEEIIVHEAQTFGELGISSDDGFGADGGGNAFDTNSLSESEEYFGDTDDCDAYYYKKDKQDCESVGFRSLNSNDNI